MTEPHSNEARRRQIARELKRDIEAGRFRPGDRLPSSRSLAGKWGVGLGTVNQAMEALAREGLVVSRPRSGRTVADTSRVDDFPATIRSRVVYVGGYPGSGKTEVARTLARATGWPILDQTTLTRNLVDTALVQLGSTIADRESPVYIDLLRPAEYECLHASIMENLGCGVSAIATADFSREFSSTAWFERTAEVVGSLGADMSVMWVRCSATSMRSNLERRGAARDTWKLAHWDRYLENVDEAFSPVWPHTVIANDPCDEPIQSQVNSFIDFLRGPA
jgi:DNA-binding transcriptional regulator YhcF (GntR family)/predicted kinase